MQLKYSNLRCCGCNLLCVLYSCFRERIGRSRRQIRIFEAFLQRYIIADLSHVAIAVSKQILSARQEKFKIEFHLQSHALARRKDMSNTSFFGRTELFGTLPLPPSLRYVNARCSCITLLTA